MILCSCVFVPIFLCVYVCLYKFVYATVCLTVLCVRALCASFGTLCVFVFVYANVCLMYLWNIDCACVVCYVFVWCTHIFVSSAGL